MAKAKKIPVPRGYYECPKCGSKYVWRSGVHFDHEVRCTRDGCRTCFDPDKLWRQEQEERLSWNTFRE